MSFTEADKEVLQKARSLSYRRASRDLPSNQEIGDLFRSTAVGSPKRFGLRFDASIESIEEKQEEALRASHVIKRWINEHGLTYQPWQQDRFEADLKRHLRQYYGLINYWLLFKILIFVLQFISERYWKPFEPQALEQGEPDWVKEQTAGMPGEIADYYQ